MKLIPLTQGKYAQVDDEDFEYLNQWKWFYNRTGKTDNGYAERSSRKSASIRMHRLVMKLDDKNLFIDHINHNGLDNQKHNLRIVTSAQNQFNKNPNKDAASKYKGVYKEIRQNRNSIKIYEYWRAKIEFNYKVYHIGYFKNETDAAKAYNDKAIELFGEYACLNKI